MRSPVAIPLFPLAGICVCITLVANRTLAEDKPALPETLVKAFEFTDKDQDQRVSLDEFLAVRNPADVAKRDFKLFDLNENGFLERAEFVTVPFLAEGPERGPLPDPMNDILENLSDSLDKFFGDWDKQPESQVQTVRFFQDLNNHFAASNIRFNNGTIDEDRNGFVNRAEAHRFLEIQLGIRRGDGLLLRKPDGRVFNNMLFLHIDQNKNNLIERTEYLERAFYTENREKEFKDCDTNGNNEISVDEWWNFPLRGINDPILEFRDLDKDLDGFVSPDELKAGTPEWKKEIAARAFPAFDLNHDGRFSLFEYRLSPQANMVLPWDWKLTDTDGNMALTFNEFQFDPIVFPAQDRQQFPFLRFIIFNRLDLNGNSKLELSEYSFKTKVPDEFFVLNEDGTGWKSLFQFGGHYACGSVAVSPDGESIAFDSWPDGQQGGSAIFVMKLADKKPRQFCTGMMPTWSKDGQMLICSRNEQKSGMWMVDVDGQGQEWVANGWGAQWSPDGLAIALTQGQELRLYNTSTEEFETILDRETNPYQQILWNMGWSPDSSQLCFKGLKADGTQEVATVKVTGERHDIKVHLSTREAINADFAWHPTRNRIVFAMICKERSVMQLYEFDPTRNDPPVLVKGQDETRNNTDICWTPDGKQLIIVSGDY